MPLISVIVPVYNVEKYIHRCIDSILVQTFSSFELILVDDGSSDKCPQICDQYAEQDDRIHVIHQKNAGLSAARNTGIDWVFSNSNSQWITFVDSDDWIHPEMVEALLIAAINNKVDVSVCSYEKTIGDNFHVSANVDISKLWKSEDFFVQHNVNATVAWGKMYRRECFSDIRYPVGKLHEDEFITYKVIFSQQKIAVINTPLYYYYQNPAGIMKSEWNPKRLDGIEARHEQINYFEKFHFKKAEIRAAKALLWGTKEQLETVISLGKTQYIRYLRKILRKELLQYRNLLDLRPLHTSDLYEAAYPHGMKIYWMWKAFLRKMLTK